MTEVRELSEQELNDEESIDTERQWLADQEKEARRNEHRVAEPGALLTPEQLAERLGVDPSWIKEQCRARGRKGTDPLPCHHVGRYLRFDWEEVKLAERKERQCENRKDSSEKLTARGICCTATRCSVMVRWYAN